MFFIFVADEGTAGHVAAGDLVNDIPFLKTNQVSYSAADITLEHEDVSLNSKKRRARSSVIIQGMWDFNRLCLHLGFENRQINGHI
jgi:hypothetical protein